MIRIVLLTLFISLFFKQAQSQGKVWEAIVSDTSKVEKNRDWTYSSIFEIASSRVWAMVMSLAIKLS